MDLKDRFAHIRAETIMLLINQSIENSLATFDFQFESFFKENAKYLHVPASQISKYIYFLGIVIDYRLDYKLNSVEFRTDS